MGWLEGEPGLSVGEKGWALCGWKQLGRGLSCGKGEGEGLGRFGLVCWVLGWVPFYFLLLSIYIFLFQTLLKLKPFEFKLNLNSNPMHSTN